MKKIICFTIMSVVAFSAFASDSEKIRLDNQCRESARRMVKVYNPNNEINVVSSEGTQRGNQYEVRMVYSRTDNSLNTAYSCSFEKIREQWVLTSTNSMAVK